MRKIFFILIILINIFCNAEWSTPRNLSGMSNYPEYMYGTPEITSDRNGILHAFWVKDRPHEQYIWYSQIYYRRSEDGGITWTTAESITPEYTDLRIREIKAVCDSKNNVHLIYRRGYEGTKILYKCFDGENWTEPIEISSHCNMRARIGIDTEERLFVTFEDLYAYYTYCDLNDSFPEWQPPQRIRENQDTVFQFTFSHENDVYGIGDYTWWEEKYYESRPYIYKYDKDAESWTEVEEIYNFYEGSLGCGIAYSPKDTIYVNLFLGPLLCVNADHHSSKHFEESRWKLPYQYGGDNGWDRQMYIDKENYLHLFELHFYDSDTMGDMAQTESIGKNGEWVTTVLDSVPNCSYTDPAVDYNKEQNRFNAIFYRYDREAEQAAVYFRTKEITTGIDEESVSIIDGYRLYQNYPNPFNPITTIEYSIDRTSFISIDVYNMKGELVIPLVNMKQNKGVYSVKFDAGDFVSGIYFYVLEANGIRTETKKMMYLK